VASPHEVGRSNGSFALDPVQHGTAWLAYATGFVVKAATRDAEPYRAVQCRAGSGVEEP